MERINRLPAQQQKTRAHIAHILNYLADILTAADRTLSILLGVVSGEGGLCFDFPKWFMPQFPAWKQPIRLR
jgi:hypothetical protein